MSTAMIERDFPKSLPDFLERFGTEACAECLVRQKWPEGFRCECGAGGRAIVARALEKTERGMGRVRLAVIESCSKAKLTAFLDGRLEPGSTVHTDGWRGYDGLERYLAQAPPALPERVRVPLQPQDEPRADAPLPAARGRRRARRAPSIRRARGQGPAAAMNPA